jgi:hypothetical protein
MTFQASANNTTGTILLTVTNTGSGPLTVSSTTLGGTNSTMFSRTVPAACTGIVPTGTCQIAVTFTPTSTGAKTGTLQVSVSGGAASQTVNLSGTADPELRCCAGRWRSAIGKG